MNTKYKQMTQHEISENRRVLLLLAAWVVTLFATLASGLVRSVQDFVLGVYLFPGMFIFLARNHAPPERAWPILLGWLIYLSITIAASLTSNRRLYFGLYTLLCLLLALNIIGCHSIPRGS